MEPDEYERMYHAENRHWWYMGMETITHTILNCFMSPRQNLKILDAGCGTGSAMSTYLAGYGKVTGFDISPIAWNTTAMNSRWAPVANVAFRASDSYPLSKVEEAGCAGMEEKHG
jgi:methylase of polypeptide subunit release factors